MTVIYVFSFKPFSSEEVLKSTCSLKNNKWSSSDTIPAKILKVFSRSFLPYLAGIINHFIATSSFPEELKLAKVMSAFSKDDLVNKKTIDQ